MTLMFGGLILPVRAQNPSESEVTFKSEVRLANFTFSVRRSNGTLVQGLAQDDFSVEENGLRQKIAFFGTESDLPLNIGLIVDASDSQSHFFKQHHKDIEKFLRAILRPKDHVFALCFGNHLRVVSDLGSDPAAVLDGLERFDHGERDFTELAPEDKREGGTALFDAVYYSIEQRLATAAGRRALILFTDGEENSSAHDELEAIDAARENDTLLYAIRYTGEKNKKKPSARQGIAILRHLASETGGTDFDALHEKMPEVFAQIAEELRALYSLGYYPTDRHHDGNFRRVRISTGDPSFSVRARSGYYMR